MPRLICWRILEYTMILCKDSNITLDLLLLLRVFRYFPDIPWALKNRVRNITWSLDKGYSKEEDIDTFPRRALFSGAKNSLSVVLVENKNNIDPTCKLSMQGFKVILFSSKLYT